VCMCVYVCDCVCVCVCVCVCNTKYHDTSILHVCVLIKTAPPRSHVGESEEGRE